jgi:Cytochrome c554 and c-prime
MIFIGCPAVIAIVMALAGLLSVCSAKAEAQTDAPATFIGAEACASCHAPETERWKTSHHALAMQKASATTILGDFANATLTHHGVTTTFSRNGEKFMVRTEGPDGAPHDYEIAYTFGVYPLQQYLIAFPGGRYQALGIAWDSRSRIGVVNAGSAFTLTRSCEPVTASIGPGETRPGTINARAAIPRI